MTTSEATNINLTEQQPDRLYLTRGEAASYVRRKWGVPCARQTLAKLAVIGGGPAFRKAGTAKSGACIYRPRDLDAWVAAKLSAVVHSTSQLKNAVANERERKVTPGDVGDAS